MKLLQVFTLIICILFWSNGCGLFSKPPEDTTVTYHGFVMGTHVNVSIYQMSDSQDSVAAANQLIREAEMKLYEIESIFDYDDPDSELSRINTTAYSEPVEVSEYMSELIEEGLRMSRLTNGAFDISLGSLIELWQYEQIPARSDIDSLLPYIGYENITFEGGRVSFSNERVKMHFGGIAKGFAVDKLKELLVSGGVNSAFIDIGGEIGVIGQTHRENGTWRVGIRNPHNLSENSVVIEVSGGTFATSGDYERFFIQDGEKYHHILNRLTGEPAVSDYASVTIISGNGAFSDALSTAIFISGDVMNDDTWNKEGFCVVYIFKELDKEIESRHFGDCDFCVSIG
ncbi:MAG: FAD:protein FMN transferase [Oscillospiraceae bacterium]|nr:FAD:protein FMN transferase [Oscillospiraceae bacterium]